MQSRILGANVRLARLFNGLSQEDVASRIGKTRQYVHKIETEQLAPPDEVVECISEMLSVRPSFFVRQASAEVGEDLFHFRKRFTAKAAIKQVALAKGEMFRRIVATLESQVFLPQLNIPQIEAGSVVDIEQAAEACRRHWGLGLGPIQNMIRVVENAGVLVTRFKGVAREVDACSIGTARPVIVVNDAEASSCRGRFDVAHELGHLVMHCGLVTGDRKTEGEANRFAGAFLLPRSTFVREFPPLRGRHLNWQGLVEMKLRWKVSKSAILYRAKQLGVITEDQYKTGVIRLSRGGEARGEREDDLIAKEVPELFGHAVRLSFRESLLSYESFCGMFGVGPEVVEEFIPDEKSGSAPTNEVARLPNNVVSLNVRRLAKGL